MDLRPLIFMPALVGAVVFGFVFLLALCNYYLATIEGTAAGAKEIEYEHLQIIDSFWKLFYLGWLIGLWLGPAFMVGRALTPGAESPWLRMLVPLAFLWLCYPVSQLSSMSASSMWMPLVPDVFARLAQKPVATLQFFLLSALVLALFGVAFKWTFQTEGEWHLLFVGAPLLTLSTLLYARILGRLAFVLRFTKGLFPIKRGKKDARPAEPPPQPARPAKRKQPRDMPRLETPDGELAGYDVHFEDEPPPTPKKRVRAELIPETQSEEPPPPPQPRPKRRPAPESTLERGRVWTDEDDEEVAAYGLREAETTAEEAKPEVVLKPTEEAIRLVSKSDAPKKPRRVWGPDVWAFLGHPGTISALVVASGLCGMVGVMVRVARQYNPAVGGE